jgi:signal transduction histidine kinase
MLKNLPILCSCVLLALVFSCKKENKMLVNSSWFTSENYTKRNALDKIKVLDSLENSSNQFENDSIYRDFLFDLSSEYYYLNKFQKSSEVSKKIIQLSSIAKDTFSVARATSHLGDTYEFTQKDSAYYFHQQSEKLYRALKNSDRIGIELVKKASILFYEGNYLESEIQVSNALQYLKKGHDSEMLFTSYTLLGCNFEKLEEYDDAIKYHLLAKRVLKDLNTSNFSIQTQLQYRAANSGNLSNVYEKKGQFDKSIQELQAILKLGLKDKWLQGYVTTIGNLGYSKMKSGDVKGVVKYFKEALSIAIKNDFKDRIVYQYINLGEYYAIQKDSLRSTAYLKQSLALAEQLKMGEEIKKSLQLLSKIDPRNAAIYDARYITYTDSLAKAQRISRNKYARIEFETAVVEDENKALSKQNTAVLIGSFLIILALVLVLVYRHIKNQKKEIKYRKAQQKAEDEIFELLKENQLKLSLTKELEQNRISKELHDSVMNRLYGARMQLGILNENDSTEAKEKRLLYVDLLQEIEQEIRTISHDLRNDVLDNPFDFISLLTNLIQLQNEIGATLFSFESDDNIDWETIDSLVKITIYRIVQESLLNVTKHANAATCKVSISLDASHLVLQIIDDGVGFSSTIQKQGIGLTNMQDRANAIKAELKINSQGNQGTTIVMKVKIKTI